MCYNGSMAVSGKWHDLFIMELRRCRSAREAARRADVPWSTVTSALRRNPAFRRRCDQALFGLDGAAESGGPDPAVVIVLPPGHSQQIVDLIQRHIRKIHTS